MQKEEPKYCKICGTRLQYKYRLSGRCARHQYVRGEDAKLTDDAAEAKGHAMSYGEYMAAKKEGRVK